MEKQRRKQLHAVVARSTFPSEKCKKLTVSAHFWKLRCRQKCTPLRREPRFEVKIYKAHQVRTTCGSCDVEKVHAVVVRRCAKHISESKGKKMRGTGHFWTSRCRKSARRCGAKHIWKSKVSKTDGFEPFLFRCRKSAH